MAIVGARSRAEARLPPGAEFRSSCGPQSGQFVVWLVTLLPVLSDVVVVRVLQGATGTGAGATTTGPGPEAAPPATPPTAAPTGPPTTAPATAPPTAPVTVPSPSARATAGRATRAKVESPMMMPRMRSFSLRDCGTRGRTNGSVARPLPGCEPEAAKRLVA